MSNVVIIIIIIVLIMWLEVRGRLWFYSELVFTSTSSAHIKVKYKDPISV